MDLKEWCEYIRDVMNYFSLSAEYVAEHSEISKRKVESIHAVNVSQDIMRYTARRVEQVVLGSVITHICCLDANKNETEKIAQLQAEVEHLRSENARYAKIIDKYLG